MKPSFSWSSVTAAIALIAISGFVCIGSARASEERDVQRPNIIVLFTDDLGYGDLGSYGQEKIRTPHLDRMAAEGMRFTQFYSGSTICAPSRCALHTGRHSGRCHIRGNPVSSDGYVSLPDQEQTIAEALKQAGYETGYIGKWAIGEEGTDGMPTRQGFDYFFGYLNQVHAHNYYPEFLIRNEDRIPLPNVVPDPGPYGEGVATEKVAYSHDLITEDIRRFVTDKHDGPFLLIVGYTIPHANNEAGDDGMEVPDYGPYSQEDWPNPQKGIAAMITRLDRDVGALIDLLKELGIDDDTLVLFTSDNGPHEAGGVDPAFFNSNGSLRGIKHSLYEGGIRVPMIARWPGVIRAGSVTDQIAYFPDIFPTVADLSDAKTPDVVDGVSLVPTLVGRPEDQAEHEYLYWEFYERAGIQAVRKGDWKAIRQPFWSEMELYNLAADPGETTNVAAQHPDIVEDLDAAMRAAHKPTDLYQPVWGYGFRGKVKSWFCNIDMFTSWCTP